MVKTTNMGGGTGRQSDRDLKVRVKTAKGRKIGSTLWLQRQLNDPYVAEAKRQGYRSRAAFKLAEIDDKYHLLRPGLRVLDLGAAPGGWSQIAAERVRSGQGKGRVVAADVALFDALPGVEILQLDVTEAGALDRILEALGGKADLVLSDMASPAMGHRATDHIRVVALVETALDITEELLAPGGAFLAKVFQGGAGQDLVTRLKKDFAKVHHVKPKASRAESPEVYVLATGFRGHS